MFRQPESLELTAATPAHGGWEAQEAMFYEQLEGEAVQCQLCFRRCLIPEGERGRCQVRENRQGRLKSLVHSRVAALHIDPVEKKPLNHFLPGQQRLCIGTAGCNFRCRFCHNWSMSQRAPEEVSGENILPPEEAVQVAVEEDLPMISFTYNEPTVFYEYMYEVARLAREEGIKVIVNTNGALNREPLEKLLPYVDGVNVDLKAFTDEFYEELTGGELETVLESLKIIEEADVWLEIVNLVIPTKNDAPEEIREMCEWIRDNLGPDVPVHFSRFTPSYRLTELPPTPVETLEEAIEIAYESGLNYVTIGNVPGHHRDSTYCSECGERIIHRVQFSVLSNEISAGRCGHCGNEIPGVWDK